MGSKEIRECWTQGLQTGAPTGFLLGSGPGVTSARTRTQCAGWYPQWPRCPTPTPQLFPFPTSPSSCLLLLAQSSLPQSQTLAPDSGAIGPMRLTSKTVFRVLPSALARPPQVERGLYE